MDPVTNSLREAPNVNELRKAALEYDRYAFWNWWLRFGVGFENLIKAAFLRHHISLLSKRTLLDKSSKGRFPLRTPAAAHVYEYVRAICLTATENEWLRAELIKLNIKHPWEINSGTLAKCKENLSLLTSASIISATEEVLISDATTVLADMRRNVDAHVFLKSQIGGSINSDLIDVYIPACNILLRVSR